MRINEIALWQVTMRLRRPFVTAFGEQTSVDSILVRMTSDELEGWGESTPLDRPLFTSEWAAGAFALLKECLAPPLVGRVISTSSELQQELSSIKGNQFAKAALETAWWDLYAQSAGQPVWRLIGGAKPAVAAGADIGLENRTETLLERIDDLVRRDVKRVKIKVKRGQDVALVESVRSHFPDLVMHIDCNASYTLDDIEVFKALDRFDLKMIEQPLAFDDLVDHAALQRSLDTPICLDESINSPDRARKAVEIGACRWMNIKVGRVGGVSQALRIYEICEEKRVPCWVGTMLESSLGQMQNVALATLPAMDYPSDLFSSGDFYATDLSEPALSVNADWTVDAPQGAGWGARPVAKRIDEHAKAHAVCHAAGK